MSQVQNVVSVHPYFKVKPGKMDAFKAALVPFIEIVATEKANLYYDFTASGDVVYCREAYIGAEGFLAHLAGVGHLLGGLMQLADLQRIEIHGPEAELEKLKPHVAAMNPLWFTYFAGVKK